MSTPVQSLTSLDWYRQALDENANGRRGKWVGWFRGLSFLLFHVSLYAVSIVLLFAIDLIRSPASFWIENVALAWAVLIVVHAAIVGLIWAIGLLKEGESSEENELRWSSESDRGGWRARHEEPQDAAFRMSASIAEAPAVNTSSTAPLTQPDPSPITSAPPQSWSINSPSVAVPPPPPVSESASPSVTGQDSLWSGWEPASPATVARQALEGDQPEDRASWKEASAAAWLTNASGATAQTSEIDTFKQQLRARLERRNIDRARARKSSDSEDSGMPPQ